MSLHAREAGNLPTDCGVSGTFRSRLMGQRLSDVLRDVPTLTFDLGGCVACRRYGSSCSICVPSLKYVGFPVGNNDTLSVTALIGMVT